jgi:hypothetical protein
VERAHGISGNVYILSTVCIDLPACTIRTLVLLPGFQKGRDIKSSLREKGRAQFWPKKGNLRRTRKNGQNFTPFRVNKMFSHKFYLTHLRHSRWLPDGAGIINRAARAPPGK